MKINEEGLELIKSFEGLRLKAYRDQVGVWTIGYGHTGPEVTQGYTVTEDEANSLFEADIEKFESGVVDLVLPLLNSNQFSALVSFAYNLGIGSLKRSTLLELVNESEFEAASREFLKWSHAGSKVDLGLVKRRKAERDLFLKVPE